MYEQVLRLARVLVLPMSAALAGHTLADVPPSQPMTTAVEPAAAATATRFDADRYRRHVERLAGDEWTGRGVESLGSSKAADYVIEQWKQAGVLPALPESQWRQGFNVFTQKALEADKASLTIQGIERPLKLNVDWTPLPYTEVGDVSGPVVFAGYGIESKEFDYDDYFDIDAAGKVVLIFRYEPRAEDPGADFGGTEPSRASTFADKAATAIRHGAKAMLIVNPPDHPLVPKDELIAFAPWASRPNYKIPMAQITQAVAEEMLRAAKMPDLRSLQTKIERDRASWSEDLADVTIDLKSGVRPARGHNLVGLIRGTTRPDEYVVLGAHYDHLGERPAGRERTVTIHNGADDNASGTAGLIEMARVLTAGPAPSRSILLVGFDAEEQGLLGSNHFVDEPPVARESIVAMLNMDMIGRYRPDKFEVSGVGSSPEFASLLEKQAEGLDLKFTPQPRVRRDSDQLAFDKASIPTLLFHTGMHSEYHRPGDDIELINAADAPRVLEFVRRCMIAIANQEERPAYEATRTTPGQMTGTPGGDPASRPAAPAGGGVRLGFLPKMDDPGPGVLVESVVENGAGAKAGLKDGDRLMRVNDTPVGSLDDYMAKMASLKTGDTATMVIQRGGAEQTLTVTFERQTPRGDRAPK